MTLPYMRPDQQVVNELERAVQHLIDEVTAWRRRCQKAEAELQALKGEGGMVPGGDVVRVRGRALELEQENLDLRSRVDRAREMVVRLQQRLAFLDDRGPAEPTG